MRIPLRTAEFGIGPAIRPMASIACLAECVGSAAARRCGACGSDLACWQRCAGIIDTTCVSACLRT
jgi:hypothetical protein